MRHVNGWKLAVVAIAVAFAGAASAQSQGTSSSSQGATGSTASDMRSGSTRASSDTGATAKGKKVDKGLQDRLEKIHAANQAEIQMGQMGAQQAQSPEVKQYAEKLEKDHQQADQKLESAAREAGIQLEGKAFQDAQ